MSKHEATTTSKMVCMAGGVACAEADVEARSEGAGESEGGGVLLLERAAWQTGPAWGVEPVCYDDDDEDEDEDDFGDDDEFDDDEEGEEGEAEEEDDDFIDDEDDLDEEEDDDGFDDDDDDDDDL